MKTTKHETAGECPAHIAAEIDALGHEKMAELWRFAPAGSSYFVADSPQWAYFFARFQKLGGMTPEVSKAIGWGPK
jgi:hypothetical protein